MRHSVRAGPWTTGLLAAALTVSVGGGIVFAVRTCDLAEAADNAPDDRRALAERVELLEREVRDLRRRLEEAERRETAERVPAQFDVRVLPGDWGDASPDDIREVCVSAASELARFAPGRDLGLITVEPAAGKGPMVLFKRGPEGERRVLLDARGNHWAQFAYQFAHEFCHILCNSREGDPSNLWFEESLCETASLFALRRMAETWKTRPPYPNWKGFAPSLAEYAETRLRTTADPGGPDLSDWWRSNSDELRKNPHDRDRNRVAAKRLLTLLEKDPRRWAATESLNRWDGRRKLSLRGYLAEWRRRVPESLGPFVEEVAAVFGYAGERDGPAK
jgi:hypothetical protein